jgi:hypothetical protein
MISRLAATFAVCLTTALLPVANSATAANPAINSNSPTQTKLSVQAADKKKKTSKKAAGQTSTAKAKAKSNKKTPAIKITSSNLNRLFGVHIPEIALGEWPNIAIGSVRLWDSGTSWRELEPAQDQFDFTKLDAAVAAANARNTPVLYVFGPTAQWAAVDQKADLRGPGAAADIKDLKDWDDYVTQVVTRYKGKIESYQIWNEASETTFWRGTPERMAELTERTCALVKKLDPGALCVAPSTTTRRPQGFRAFFPPYLEALKKDGWPKDLDVWAVHAYPVSTGKPADRRNQIELFKKSLTDAGAPNKPIWETELNFGLAGPGPNFPAVNFDPAVEAQLIKQAYLDSVALGLARVYWYSWVPDGGATQLGVILYRNTEAALAFDFLLKSMDGASATGCKDLNESGTSKVCSFNAPVGVTPQSFSIAWSINQPGTFTVPAGVTKACDYKNVCQTLTAGQQLKVDQQVLKIS